MSSLRLVVLGPGHPFRGGIARTTTDLVLALRKRGHEVTFLTPRRQYPGWLYPGRDDRDPDGCPQVEGAVAVLDPLAPRRWPAARRVALEATADAWLLPYWTWVWAPWWRFLLAGGSGRRPPAVAIAHNLADHEAGLAQRLAARLVLARCEGLFTHAQRLAAGARATYPAVRVAGYPLPPPRPGAMPPREEARIRLGLGSGERLALFLGLVRPYKGADLLVEAARRLAEDSPWRVVIAGEPWGGEAARLGELVHRHGLARRVRLDLRWIPEPEVAGLLAAADVAVLPYRAASQSAVAALAFAHGVPVVCTRVGGLAEVVDDGVSGVVVPPGSADALAEALTSLDDRVLGRLREGVRAAVERLTWDRYAQELERLVREVIAGR